MPLSFKLRNQVKQSMGSFLSGGAGGHGNGLAVVYQTRPSWPHSGAGSYLASISASTTPVGPEQVDIAVLDSSFNPPHLAHLALASSKPILSANAITRRSHYPAHLFLLSSRNADKGHGRPGDASPLQRVLMMVVLAKDLEERMRQEGVDETRINVAVAVCGEPLMKDKSSLVHDWLQQQRGSEAGATPQNSRLHWVVGWDTLIRFFALKYYPSREEFAKACHQFFVEEGTTFVCARRAMRADDSSQDDDGTAEQKQRQEEYEFLYSDLVRPWVEQGSVAMFDLSEEVRHVSSTQTRQLVRQAGLAAEQKKMALQRQGLLTAAMAEFVVDEGIYD